MFENDVNQSILIIKNTTTHIFIKNSGVVFSDEDSKIVFSELVQDNPNLVEGFDSPICLICTIVKIFNDYYYFKIVSHQFNVSEDSYLSSHLALHDKPSFFAIL